MRHTFIPQMSIGAIGISAIEFNIYCRHEIIPILMALQHLYVQCESVTRTICIISKLYYFIAGTEYVPELAERRVLKDESIANPEKVLSLFEPDTELINRGKRTERMPDKDYKRYIALGALGRNLHNLGTVLIEKERKRKRR